MIEFKGAYYQSKSSLSQPVLVQFDGVLLHIWNISNPFHRILSSEAFRLPFAPGPHRCWVKLPSGGRIETDDIQALVSLKSHSRSPLPPELRFGVSQRHAAVAVLSLVSILTTGLFLGLLIW